MSDSIIHSEDEHVERLERKVYDLKNLIGLGISLASNLNFESLVESILYSCIGQIFVEQVAILLQVDIDVPNFYIHMVKGMDEEYDDSVILDDDSLLVKFFDENPGAHDYITLTNQKELKEDLKKLAKLNPKCIVPMKSKNSLNGMIILGNKLTGEDFTIGEMDFLKDLAKFAAIVVENSRLYLMATLDRMTRLYIHHYFQERLHEEIRRSERKDEPLCLIMMDIDHFKSFNDTYGHQQGDIVLKEAAKVIKNQLRATDIAARYGGEEFAIILPETDLDAAVQIADRLRIAIEEFPFSGQKEPLHVTISLGVSMYDIELDEDKKDLIEKTDKALYKAKETGRNRVVAHR